MILVEIFFIAGRFYERPRRTASSRIDLYEKYPDQKTSDMGKPGNSTSHAHIHNLQEKPKAKDKGCRDGHDADEKKQEDQGQHICARVKDQISSEHTRYRTTGPDHGNL